MDLPVSGRFIIPDVLVTHFHLREGDVVADFGSGSGFFLPALSKAVGEEGKVYACEIQKVLVEKIGELIESKNLNNVYPLWCDLEEPNGIKIPDNELDAAVLVNTLFIIEQKEAAIKEMSRTLRSGGKFFVADWTESFSGMGPEPKAVVTKDAAVALFEAAGFVLEREYPSGDHHYGLAFRKP